MLIRSIITVILITIALVCLLIYRTYAMDDTTKNNNKSLFAMVIAIAALLCNLPLWLSINQ